VGGQPLGRVDEGDVRVGGFDLGVGVEVSRSGVREAAGSLADADDAEGRRRGADRPDPADERERVGSHRGGRDVVTVQPALGHASATTPLSTYSRLLRARGVTPPRDPPRLRPGPGATSAGVVSDAAWLHDFAATLRPGAQRSAPQSVVASPLTSRAGLPRCAEVSVASAGDSVLQTLEVGRPGRGGRLGLGWTPSGRSSRPATQTPPRSSPRQRTGRPTPGGVRRCAC
jgi:hypothetical protein